MACMQVLGNLKVSTDDTELLDIVRGRRMHNEWLALQNDPPPGMTLKERRDQNTITEWVIELKGPPRTLYEGQRFQLLFTFSSRYPYEPPQVMFTGENIPVNPLVYNNGHIRLSNLAEHWSPVLTVRSWCFSIISILCIGNVKGRLQKEWLALQKDPPPGMTLKERRVQNTITEWVIELKGLPRTLYEGQKFQLLFTFSSRFPFEPPQVMFTGENIPVHPFVDSNGHIRLSSLTVREWTPALTVRSVCLSIISMLCMWSGKRRPPDKSPKKTTWWWWCW